MMPRRGNRVAIEESGTIFAIQFKKNRRVRDALDVLIPARSPRGKRNGYT
jgi:hypothetical protein